MNTSINTPTPEEESPTYMFINDEVLDKEALWAEMITQIEAQIGLARLKSTFQRVTPLGITGEGELVLAVPNKFNFSLINSMHLADLTELASSISGHPLTCELVLDEQLAKTAGAESEAEAVEAILKDTTQPELVDNNMFEPRFTFDSFVVGESNELAYSAAQAVAENPGHKYNPLFIWGGSGLGKTHLLHAIGAYIAECFPNLRIIYTTLEQLLNQYVVAIADKTSRTPINILRDHYRNTDVLIVDDIQFLEGKKETAQFFFHTFNTLIDQHKQVVLASDRPPDSLDLDERITSRFKMGMMADIQLPSYEMKLAILHQYTQNLKANFDEESLVYLAEKSSSSIREMEGILNRISALAEMRHVKMVDIKLTEYAAAGYFTEKAKRPISLDMIQDESCRFYHLKRDELIGSKRRQDIAHARHIAMYLCSELTDSSYPAIGRAFGGKDHTTVMHAVRKIKLKMREDRDIFNQIKILTDNVNKRVM